MKIASSHNICWGRGAGMNLTEGDYNILIGDDVDTPTPTTSHYVNIAGHEIKASPEAVEKAYKHFRKGVDCLLNSQAQLEKQNGSNT